MPKYEHVFICRQDLTSVQAETLAEEFKANLTENGGKVIDSEYWGLRSIAYRMNKNRKGHYFLFKSDSDKAEANKIVNKIISALRVVQFNGIRELDSEKLIEKIWNSYNLNCLCTLQ